MEWIRISRNKLKIMLTAEDAARYALPCEQTDFADVITRQAFREILTDVRRETGFDATEDKLYIQMYPGKKGGCELFVTKMGLLLSDSEPNAPGNVEKKQKNAAGRRYTGVFSFSGSAQMVAVCRRLFACGYAGESEAWRDERGRFWLLLTDASDPYIAAREYGFIREYGNAANAENARLYLPEHGRTICAARAVETLCDL